MSENVNNNIPNPPAGNGTGQPEKMGCRAMLGLALLITAILVVLFILVVKPHLESEGIDVDGFFAQSKQRIAGTVEQIQDSASEAAVELKNKSREVAGKMEEAAEDLEEKTEDLEEKAGEVKESVENLELPSGDNGDGSWY